MKIYLVVFASLFFSPVTMAEGSLGWVDACQRLEKDCPKLLATINQCFDVSPGGWALRLGPRSIDVIEGRLGVGTRVPPYKFDCKVKGTTGSYPLSIEISDWDDGWKFIIREKQMKKPAEQAGAGQPDTASESKLEGGENPKSESVPAPR